MLDISAASARIAHSPFRSIGRTFSGADVTFNVIRNMRRPHQGPGQIVSPVTVGAVLANYRIVIVERDVDAKLLVVVTPYEVSQ